MTKPGARRLMSSRFWRIFAALIIVSAVIAVYASVDPASGYYPRCVFKMLTGWDCPGCGSQRAFHAMLHGDIAAAWSYNPFVFIILPIAAVLIVVESLRNHIPRLYQKITLPAIAVLFLVAAVVWTITRNLLL